MNKVYIPTSDVTDWKQFLADPEKQWKRGYSALAAASSWEAADGPPQEIANIIGTGADLLFAFPELKSPFPSVVEKASVTSLRLFGANLLRLLWRWKRKWRNPLVRRSGSGVRTNPSEK